MQTPDAPAAYQLGETVSQWLVERGQPEGEQNAVWLENSVEHPASHGCWTRNARDAAMFPDKETCEAYIAERGLEARAVEHGFMTEAPEQERLYTQADLDFFSANADEYATMAFRFGTALRAIQENAEAHHGDDAAKGRALSVIAKWAKEALDADV